MEIRIHYMPAEPPGTPRKNFEYRLTDVQVTNRHLPLPWWIAPRVLGAPAGRPVNLANIREPIRPDEEETILRFGSAMN
ncbi:MAG: hypothetical protein NUV51_11625 [Sulfuricaulis sp.]|nr:hypothetical protein [Sulfuricaulis sp.]